MNREQEDLQFLGFIGIYKESFKLIFKWPKTFTKITLALILPFSCIILANAGISTFLSNKIINNMSTLDATKEGSPTYINVSKSINSEWLVYWLVNLIYLMFSLIFLLLSVSAVVYTIASIYTGKQITFRKVMSVVPKVWKRIMVTFISLICVIFIVTFVFMLVTLIVGAIIFSIYQKSNRWKVGLVILVAISVLLYVLAMVYMSFIWQLAYVISVLEKHSGFKAMSKSKALIKGKMGSALVIFLVWGVCSLPNHLLVKQISDGSLGVGERIWYGILSLVWMTFVYLLNLVVQTVLYFVCKLYHHENIDKLSLADHLEGYHGEYVPLNSKTVQLESLNV